MLAQRQTGNNNTNIQKLFLQNVFLYLIIQKNGKSVRYQKFEALISQPRLSRYKAACVNDTRKTVRLYRANIRISQAFLAVLGIFEIVLRNKIDTHYKARFPAAGGAHEWLFNSTLPGGFLTAPNCRNSRLKITDTYNSLGTAYTHDKLLSGIKLWVLEIPVFRSPVHGWRKYITCNIAQSASRVQSK